MLTDNAKQFLSENHHAVLTTFRKNGAAQMSILSVGYYKEGVAFTTTDDRAKLVNLRRAVLAVEGAIIDIITENNRALSGEEDALPPL